MNRRGFTVIELLVVFALIGILASIAMPVTDTVRRRAMAAKVVGDFHAIQTAVYSYAGETGVYPPTAKWGVVPPLLAPSLPDGFEFRYGKVTYRWHRWALPNGMPRNRRQKVLLGVQVRSSDTRLIKAIKDLYKGPQAYGRKKKVTLVIE